MNFTYDAYRSLLREISEQGYQFTGYKNWQKTERCVILRHDIDNDIEKAVRLALIEGSGGGDKHIFCSAYI